MRALDLLPLLFFPLPSLTACIYFRGNMPFDSDLPFIASIAEISLPPSTQPNVTLCTLHTTYNEHDRHQRLKNAFPDPEEERNELRGKGDKMTWGFRRWEMECIAGVKGWVGVGLRSVGFIDTRLGTEKGKRRDMNWISDVKEDVWGEQWVFSNDLGCGPSSLQRKKMQDELERKKKKAQEAEREKAMSEADRKKEDAKMLILAAVKEKDDLVKEKGKEKGAQ